MIVGSVHVELLLSFLVQAGRDFPASPERRVATSYGLADWALLALAAMAVVVSIVLCAKYLLRPGETSEDHIKRRVLQDEGERGSR